MIISSELCYLTINNMGYRIHSLVFIQVVGELSKAI